MSKMQRLGEELLAEIEELKPEGFLLQLVQHDAEHFPSRGMAGGLPIMVVGHKGLSSEKWKKWVMGATVGAYGVSFAERVANEGIDLRELLPYGVIGRRFVEDQREDLLSLTKLGELLQAVEQWPDLYNLLVFEMRGQEPMPCGDFVERVWKLPCPKATTDRVYLNLGDLIDRTIAVLPRY